MTFKEARSRESPVSLLLRAHARLYKREEIVQLERVPEPPYGVVLLLCHHTVFSPAFQESGKNQCQSQMFFLLSNYWESIRKARRERAKIERERGHLDEGRIFLLKVFFSSGCKTLFHTCAWVTFLREAQKSLCPRKEAWQLVCRTGEWPWREQFHQAEMGANKCFYSAGGTSPQRFCSLWDLLLSSFISLQASLSLFHKVSHQKRHIL